MDLLYDGARFHGNGFIQVPLNDLTRMHIFDPDFEWDRVENARIHDHRFWFTSKVLVGRIFHRTYNIERLEGGDHGLYTVDSSQEGEPLIRVASCDVYENLTQVISEGDSYKFGGSSNFHDTFAEEFTVTIMTKTAFEPKRSEYDPWVVALGDEKPDNAFDNQPRPCHMRESVQKAWRMLV